MRLPAILSHKLPNGAALLILAMVAVAGFGTAIAVNQTSYSGIFADITSVGDALAVTSADITIQKADAAAVGATPDGAAELALATPGAANAALGQAHWVYKVTVAETSPPAVTAGTYRVELFVDDVSQGALYVKQGPADAAGVEAATLKWDLGADLPVGATAYRVVITEV